MKNKHELPGFVLRLFKRLSDSSFHDNVLGDIEEIFRERLLKDGRLSVGLWLLKQMLRSAPVFISDTIYRRTLMLKNYLKIAFRNIMKYKSYSIINISGLAIGIACCILIFIYVNHELSYDKFHPDNDRIYRVSSHVKLGLSDFSTTSAFDPIVPVLKEQYPEVEDASRLGQRFRIILEHNNENFYEDRLIYVEKNIRSILDFRMIEGTFDVIFENPNTIIISEYIAGKYFKDQPALGSNININNQNFIIGGIVKDPPRNTHLKFNFMLSMQNYFKSPEEMTNWANISTEAYLKLKPGVDGERFAEKIKYIAHEYRGEYFDKKGWTYTTILMHVKDIHLRSTFNDELEAKGNIVYVWSISIIGVLILVIACLNFINLTIARASSRTKEVGMRKVAGAQRRQLICQFIGESFLMSILASGLSLAAAFISLPYFSSLVDRTFTINDMLNPSTVFGLALLVVVIGLGAGSYPAFFLSKFKPLSIIAGTYRFGKSGSFSSKRAIVVFQFSMSIILIICTMVVFRQIDFMKNQYLGFNKDQKIAIPVRYNNNYESIKNEFLNISGITGVSASAGTLGRTAGSRTTRLPGEDADEYIMNYLYFDFDFIPVYKIEIAAGRSFNKDLITDRDKAFIINEAASRMLGFSTPEDAVGKYLEFGDRSQHRQKEIIGVTKDFHYSGLQDEIAPLVMGFGPQRFGFLNLSVNTLNLSGTISSIREKWMEHELGNIFLYRFIDEYFDRFYDSEERIGRIFTTFASLAIFLSCLGLFSLSAFVAEQRTKEIGIRKTLGATVSGLITLLSGDFIKWVLLANLIAIPLSYVFMDKWLQDFAYRIGIGLDIFLISFLIIITISVFTISLQTIKAALANPVDSLRYE
ncbi:MAG: FtsX-like permease family protein [bacterium]|nr:FtsX-like permease family protein [bacterium]